VKFISINWVEKNTAMSDFKNLNSVIGNGKSYKVPIYQRDYSWRKNEEVEDLWNDILELEIEKSHYMGYLVLLPENKVNESYLIIDGQQRLITLSILTLAVTRLLKEWAEEGIEKELNEERRKEEIRRYLGNVDTTATGTGSFLPIIPKLTLNRNNDNFYQSYLMQLREPATLGKQKPSVKLMQQAFNFFYDKLKDKFGKEKRGASLTLFLEKTVGIGLVFTVIEVPDDVEAFKVFETLNARGIKLSPADLLKNYLFSKAAKRGMIDLDEAERRWINISDTLANGDITTFIRHYWNSKYKKISQTGLFKVVKKEIDDANKAFDFLDSLEKQAEYYTGFDNPFDDSLWDKEERKNLHLLKLLEVTTCYSLMLSFLENLPRKDFAKLLKEITILSLRASITLLNPNEAEVVYSNVANQIYEKKLTDVRSIILALKSIYVEDKIFENAFATAQINTRRKKGLVKYLLIKLENQIANTEYSDEDSQATIEHILPENPGSVWEDSFKPDLQDEYIYRLGNYALLSASTNKKLDNETSFIDKLEVYKQSPYKITYEFCLFEAFTPKELQTRQARLAKLAKGIWKSSVIGI